MRHDSTSGAIIIMLRSLKMHGMAQAVTDLMEQGAPALDAAVPMLAQLLKVEVAEREVRSIAYHTKAARSSHTSLPHPGDRKRQLPLQDQLRSSCARKKKVDTDVLTQA